MIATARSGNGVWKTVAITVIGMFLTGASAWVSIAKDVVTEPEMVSYVNNSAPYVRDQKLILDYLEDIKELRVEVRELRIAVERLEARIDPND